MRKNQASQLLSVLLLLLISVAVMVFVLPMRGDVDALRVEKEALTGQLQAAENEYSSLQALSEEVSGSNSVREELLAAVPEGFSQDDLILELSEIADGAGFKLNAMNFSESVSQNYGSMVTVAANLSGDYEDLLKFLQKVENAERLMRVTSVSVQLTSTEDVVFNLNIEAYHQ
jgi:Tfp pilus assembly protein PilO